MKIISKNSSTKDQILVIGDIILDRYFQGYSDRVSPEAPVPILNHTSTRSSLGGAANVACSIATMGKDVCLIGAVGEDPEAFEVTDLFKRFTSHRKTEVGNIDISGIFTRTHSPTTLKTRLVTNTHQLARIDREERTSLDSREQQKVTELLLKEIPNSSIVVISDYAKGMITKEVLKVVFQEAKRANIDVIVDPKQEDLVFYKGATLLTPNQSEMTRYIGKDLDSEQAIHAALRITSENTGASVLVTQASEGATLYCDGEFSHIATDTVKVADVSGAGDTLIATLAVFRSEGNDWNKAIAEAVKAATYSVQHSGVVHVLRKDLESYLNTSKSPEIAKIYSIESLQEARQECKKWKQDGSRIVLTNGCFDLLHKGHLSSLKKARSLGDKLVVALNSDKSVRSIKGISRPLIDEASRAEILAALRFVDMVVLFNEVTPLNVIRNLEPNILVKGSDYKVDEIVGADIVKSYGGQVKTIDLVDGWSTSNIIENIKNA